MIYLVCSTMLLIGVLGLLAQVLLGGAHVGHHAGFGHHHHQDAGHGSHGHQGRALLLTMLSPLTLFSICVGAGATGLLLKHYHFSALVIILAALAGGLAFYLLVIRNLFSFVFRFASNPSTTLEGAIGQEAEALSGFSTVGKGLVRVKLDGQIIQILATLEDDERNEAVTITRGDRLTITSVDGHTNSCRVARL